MIVSVYMPTKNRVSLVRKAVESVLSQTYPDIELIVVDDGSTDGTRDYLRSVSLDDPRMTVITHETSRGSQASRNEAIAAATGSFITGIDDDDEYHPRRIEIFVRQWEMLAGCGIAPAFLYSQDELWSDGKISGYSEKKGSVRETDLLIRNEVGNQVFAPRQAFLDAGGFDEKLPAWQDLDMFIRLLRNDGTGRLVDMPTYRFDVSPRPDRISVQRPRIRRAFDLISAKRNSNRERQQLMLQMFAPHYGFRPRLREACEFITMGRWPEGWLAMTKRFIGKY